MEKERNFMLLVLILLSISLVSAAPQLTTNKQAYYSGETLIGTLTGDFAQTISPSQVSFFEGAKPVSFEYSLSSYNSTYYLYVYWIRPGNFTVQILNILYRDPQLKSITIQKNFSITSSAQSISIKPGFVITSNNAAITLANKGTSNLTASYSFESNSESYTILPLASKIFTITPTQPFSYLTINSYETDLIPVFYTPLTPPVQNQTTTISCTDTDSGQNFNLIGNTSIFINSTILNETKSDYCLSNTTLVEFDCSTDNTRIINTTVNCTFGCQNSICISAPVNPGINCTDSDGGAIFTIKGNTTLTNGSIQTDSCSGSILTEFFCSNNSINQTTVNCTFGCANGTCLANNTVINNTNNTNPIIPGTTYCTDADFFCINRADCPTNQQLSNYYCSSLGSVCCQSENLKSCADYFGKVCQTGETCTGLTRTSLESDNCCLGDCTSGININPGNNATGTDCDNQGYTCKDSCPSNQESVSYSCGASSSQVCCRNKTGTTTPSSNWWIWLLVIGIILVLAIILFLMRDKLKLMWFSSKNKVNKSPFSPFGQGPRPGFPPFRPGPMPAPSRPGPRPIPQARPVQKPLALKPVSPKKENDVFKKLKEMSK